MEITQKSATAPSWLSIVTKAKRFSTADVQIGHGQAITQCLGTIPVQQHTTSRQNGHGSKVKCKQSINGEESTSKSKSDQEISSNKTPYTQPPKKYIKRQRERSIISRSELDYQHKIKIELITPQSSSNSILTLSSNQHSSAGASSTSSSPSPGLLSCGSASSAEDDLSSVSTSTSTLSAFSNSSSPSPKPGFGASVSNDFDEENSHYPGIKPSELGSCYINFHSLHPNNFINMESTPQNFPSNRISVIRSTSSYFQNVQYCEGEEEEPQDLSVKKPKRSTTTSSYNVSNLISDEYQCVQDLSVRPSTSTISNNDRPHKPRPQKLVSSVESTPISSPLSSPSKPLELLVEKVEPKKCSSPPTSAYCHKLKYGRTDDNEGELIIADILPEKNFVKKNVKVEFLGKNEANNKIHKTTTEEKVKEPITKDVETEVKSRRGRKRKDEETPSTKFDCFLCSFTSMKENVLRNHMVRMHTVKGNRGNVKCTVCAYSCPSLEELRSHQEMIHGQGTREEGSPTESKVAFHACHHCTKKFRSVSQLEAHLRLIAQKQLWKDLKTRRVM